VLKNANHPAKYFTVSYGMMTRTGKALCKAVGLGKRSVGLHKMISSITHRWILEKSKPSSASLPVI
jgi:hypothetical protein